MSIVFRVQAKEFLGVFEMPLGPYRYDCQLATNMDGSSLSISNNHPVAECDSLLKPQLLELDLISGESPWSKTYYHEYLFCFNSLNQLREWFSNIPNYLEEASEVFEIGVYELSDEHILVGQFQTMALGTEMQPIEKLPIGFTGEWKP